MQIEVGRQSQPGALMMMSNHKYGCNFFFNGINNGFS